MRYGRFYGFTPPNGAAAPVAHVVLEDGTSVFTAVPDAPLAGALRFGDVVLLDGKGAAVLQRAPEDFRAGEEARFERRLDARHLEVTLREQERCVFVASDRLAGAIDRGEVRPGASLIVQPRQWIAFDAVPREDGLAHYQFLQRQAPPCVQVERDIGSPPRVIDELTALVRLEMTRPELRRRYRLRRCVMTLLSGVSGSGKTLAIHAIWRRIYEVMSEVTGVPVGQLPPRVFWLRPGQVLSHWFGKTDRNYDRFFNEIEQLADERFVGPDGREHTLPVLAVFEEIDGIARARGSEPIYDRVLSTLLQRLDASRPELREKLIVFLGTTNEPGQVDRAFLRRIGGKVETFGRLDRRGFGAVLEKHLTGLPLATHNGAAAEELRRQFIGELTAWLFSPNGADRGVVELTYAGSTTPEVRHRRDFLTGALIDRAVQETAEAAVQIECEGRDAGGVTLEGLARALDGQVRSVARQLTEHNVRHYLDVPDGARVATVRRLPQPAFLPAELLRH
jgi:SpoVK/Ycf46/Vps4 family AAA+-type ATPase